MPFYRSIPTDEYATLGSLIDPIHYNPNYKTSSPNRIQVVNVALILEIVRLTVFAETGTHITKAKMESHRVIPSSENVFESTKLKIH